MATTKVVILNWNGRKHLSRFLPLVVANTPEEVGIVVADNRSDDGSCDLVETLFPEVEIVRLDRNYGYAGGYNVALKRIDADYYILLNSDVEPAPGWCAPLLKQLDDNSRVAAVMPKILSCNDPARFEYAGASGGFIDILGYPFCRGRILSTVECDQGQYDDPREVFWASGACFAVRSKVFHGLGGFDSRFFAHMEEIDFCWRAQLEGYGIMVEPGSRVFHLGGGTLEAGSAHKLYLNYRNNLAMLYKNLPKSKSRLIIPVRMVLDGLAAVVYLAGGRYDLFKAVWRAHADFRGMKTALRADRQTAQTGHPGQPAGVYCGSIILRYIFGRRHFGSMM